MLGLGLGLGIGLGLGLGCGGGLLRACSTQPLLRNERLMRATLEGGLSGLASGPRGLRSGLGEMGAAS